MKKMLMVATVPSMIGCFNMHNIQILLDLGYEIHVACNFKNTNIWSVKKIRKFKQQLKKQGIKYHQIDFSRNPKEIIKIWISLEQVILLIKREKFDFVHCHTPIAGAISRISSFFYGIKVIYTAHGFHFYNGAPKKNWLLFYPIEKELSRITDVLLTINREDYKRAKNKFHAKKVEYIPGVGVDTNKFATCVVDKDAKRKDLGVRQEAFILLSVGELSERKNQRIVIEALYQMKRTGEINDIVYLIIGQGKLEGNFKELIQRYGLEDNIKLLGFRDDIDELCKTADCFIHPSIREGFGIAPMEAMAAGLPLISADINGIRDYTEEGKTGCCINPKSVEEIIKAIKKMKEDIEFRRTCGLYNAKVAKAFDVSKTNEIMKEIYKDMEA